MGWFALIVPLAFAAVAILLAHDMVVHERNIEGERPPWRQRMFRAAMVLLGLSALLQIVGLVTTLVRGEPLQAAGVACFLVPAQIALAALAAGMLMLAHPRFRNGGAGPVANGITVAFLWLVTFGIGACYASLLTGGMRG